MAVPKRKTSRSVTKQRRTHQNIAPVTIVPCPSCSELIRPHHVCPKCGNYGGKEIISVED